MVHKGERHYACEQAKGLFECYQCLKTFATLQGVKRHNKIHKDISTVQEVTKQTLKEKKFIPEKGLMNEQIIEAEQEIKAEYGVKTENGNKSEKDSKTTRNVKIKSEASKKKVKSELEHCEIKTWIPPGDKLPAKTDGTEVLMPNQLQTAVWSRRTTSIPSSPSDISAKGVYEHTDDMDIRRETPQVWYVFGLEDPGEVLLRCSGI